MKIALAFACLMVVSLCATACANIPSDNVYYLTSFCDQTTACGISCGNCTWYYAADSQRFKCKSTINCNKNGKSANLEVIDYGPNCDYEIKSGKPIIDASYSTCKLFAGSNSCGWSDKIPMTCKKIAGPAYHRQLPLGECSWDQENTKLPFCHLEENRGRYGFENIEEWVELTEEKELLQ